MRRLALLAPLLLFLAPTVSTADDPGNQTPASPAEEILRTFKDHDTDRLKDFAALRDPDPFGVVDDLFAMGSSEAKAAAAAFAAVVPGEVGAALSSYAAAQKDAPDPKEARGAFDEAAKAFRDAKHLSALQLLDSAAPPPRSVLAVRMAALRAQTQHALKRFVEAGGARVKEADAAEAIGWLVAAVEALKDAEIQATRSFDWETAKARCQRLQAIQEGMGDAVGAAKTLADRGTMAVKQANFPEALRFYEESRRIFEASGEVGEALTTLGNEGAVRSLMGQFPLALSIQERVLKDLLAAGDDDEGIGDAYDHLGTLRMEIGDAEKAGALYEKALERYRRAGSREGEAMTLGNIGILHFDARELDEADARMEDAQKIFEEERHVEGLAQIHQCMAEVLMLRGEFDRALTLLRSTIHTVEEIGNAELAAYAYCSMGDAYRQKKQYPDALKAYDKALAEGQRLQVQKLRVDVRAGLAKTHLAMGNPKEAVKAAREAVVEVTQMTVGWSEDRGIGARGKGTDVFETGALAALAGNDLDALAYFLEADRAGQLLASLGGRLAIGRATVPAALEREGEDAGRRAAEALAKYRGARESGVLADARARWKDYEKARATAEEVEDRIQADTARFSQALFPRLDGLADVRRNLGEGTALVLYALLPGEAIAVVATKQEARVVRLGATVALERALADLRLGDRAKDSSAALAAARKALVEPLHLDAGVRRLLVSPDGVLASAPFSALVGDLDTAFVPSGSAYGLLLADRAYRGKGVLALGDPDYGAKRDPAAIAMLRGGVALAPLPHTRDEVAAIAKGKDDVALLGKDASIPGLKGALAGSPARRWRAVHFACHGHVDLERPTRSSLALTSTEGDDGFLTGLQVFRLRIPTDLAVLSACETGRGPVVRGEGLVALARAFMFAGAPRVLVSLWEVDDEATLALMTKFYAAWDSGKSPAAALREAQALVRAQPRWAHPAYWAAWVLWGLPE